MLTLSYLLRHITFNKLTFLFTSNLICILYNVFKFGLQLMFVNPSRGFNMFVLGMYFHNCICPNLHQICYNPFSYQSKVLYVFWFISWLFFFKFLKYASKTSTFCIVVFGYSAVICSVWFLRFIICFRIHAGLASWFYVLQVIILVFVFVVNLISFYLAFLCGYNGLVDQKLYIYYVSFG